MLKDDMVRATHGLGLLPNTMVQQAAHLETKFQLTIKDFSISCVIKLICIDPR